MRTQECAHEPVIDVIVFHLRAWHALGSIVIRTKVPSY